MKRHGLPRPAPLCPPRLGRLACDFTALLSRELAHPGADPSLTPGDEVIAAEGRGRFACSRLVGALLHATRLSSSHRSSKLDRALHPMKLGLTGTSV
jgi:hypothetical protein